MLMPEARLKEEIIRRWDESSETYDDHASHGIRGEEEQTAWKDAFKKIIPSGAVDMLDVGCGTGELSILMAEMGYEVTGLDLSKKMLTKAKAKAKKRGLDISYKLGDAENPPFNDNTFDVVFTRHLLWTLPNPQKALEGWRRLLKDGGRAMIVDGVWDNRTLDSKVRNLTSNIAEMIIEGKLPWKGHYPKEVEESLPNRGGTPLEKSESYLKMAGFVNIGHIDLLHIRAMQRKRLDLSDRIRRNYSYYLVFANKPIVINST